MAMDFPALDPKWLLLLDALHRTGSVTRSAERLGVSQPTVSIWLAQARRALNDPLFVRTPAGMQPTPRATAMIEPARAVLDGLRQLAERQAPLDPSRLARPFRIFMTDASHITLLPALFAKVRSVAPGVQLEAATLHAGMARELEAGDADLALGLIPGLEAGFFQQSLFEQDWVCLARPGHPRLRRTLSLQKYMRVPHVGIVAGTGQALLEAALQRGRVQRNVVLRLPGFLGLPAVLLTSDLIATLPRQIGETLARSAGLLVLPCPVPVPRFTVKQYWHARFHRDPANQWLRGICASLFMHRTRTPGGGRSRISPA